MAQPKTILTVDDSRTIRDMLMSTLAAAGYEVVQAEDGVEALERLRETRPAAILTDINMPRMDGFELIAEVRRDSANRSIPILVLTTESEPDRKERAKAAGATGWIVKPFNPEKLLDALRRVGA
ncbi:MAG TPA: response regulator [Kofleriaceae bacterium]|nr:response regulator [Kofleriaceae bacterium]